MNYKVKDFKFDSNEPFFSRVSDDEEPVDLNQPTAIDPSSLESIFQNIQTACKSADQALLINQFEQLIQIYSKGPVESRDIALKYDFFIVCSEILTMCGSTAVIENLLRCLCFAIVSDSKLLDQLSDKVFSKQLAYCIDDQGSIIYGYGFEILSKTIKGYSKKLFSKICYIFRSTEFQRELTQKDIENLNHFGIVFCQLSKFTVEDFLPIMLIIAKIFILYGLFNYGVEILINLTNLHEKAKSLIFHLNGLTENEFAKISKEVEYFYSDFKICNDIANSFNEVQPSIILVLVKNIPFHKDRSIFYNFDFEISITNTLTLIIDLIEKWGNYYRYVLNNIDRDYLFELMNYKENEDSEVNYTIQSLALSLFAEIFDRDKDWDVLVNETKLAILAIEAFAEKLEDMPLKIRASSLKGINKITLALIKSQVDPQSQAEALEVISKYEIVDKIIDFFDGDSSIQIDAAFTLFALISTSEEALNQAIKYIDYLEELENETEDKEMRGQLIVINAILRNYKNE